MLNVVQVRQSIDSSNSWIVHNENNGFIIDCGLYWDHGLLLAKTWREKLSNRTLPLFIYLTHTHPDHILGLVGLFNDLNTTKIPVYVSSSYALNEINYWLNIWQQINPFQFTTLLDIRQSPEKFVFSDHIKVLDHTLKTFNGENIKIISNFPVAESIHSSMVYIPSIKALFTGDIVSVKSHLLLSPFDKYPDSDNHICNWIGILQSLICTFPETTKIYPAHGDGPSTMSFVEIIETNIQWLTFMRTIIFNSCNATAVMRIVQDVFRNYSNFEQSRASISNQIPNSAISIGCKCSRNSTNPCMGIQLPYCQFIPANKTQSIETVAVPLACLHKKLSSSSFHVYVQSSLVFIMLLSNIF